MRLRMGRKRLFIVGVVALAIALLVLLWPRGPKEPVYQGKRLSAWLIEASSESGLKTAPEAIQALGTNAIPYLLFEFERTEPRWKQKLLGWNILRQTLNVHADDDVWRHYIAGHGLAMLGSNAS